MSANVGADTKIGVGGTLSAQLGEGADVVTSRAHIALGDGLEVISGDSASMAAGGQITASASGRGEHRIGYGHIKRVARRVTVCWQRYADISEWCGGARCERCQCGDVC